MFLECTWTLKSFYSVVHLDSKAFEIAYCVSGMAFHKINARYETTKTTKVLYLPSVQLLFLHHFTCTKLTLD